MMFVPPALLAASAGMGHPGLAFMVLIFVVPFLRVAFGDASGQVPQWSDKIATVLGWLPTVCAVAYVSADVWVLVSLHRRAFDVAELALLGLSMWASALFASCVAHELVHSPIEAQRVVGRVLSGLIGYPVLEHEHRAHHAKSGNVEAGEWPAVHETVWGFSLRRMVRVLVNAWEGHQGDEQSSRLLVALGAFVTLALGFFLAGGLAGFVLFVAVSMLIFWTQQVVTYVQHWGLGEDSFPGAVDGAYAWEDLCRLQAWLTLGISYHQAHHATTSVPYYRAQPSAGSPRAPAGYVFLFFACLVPPVWRAVMEPALKAWKSASPNQGTAGRKLICFSY